MSQIDNNSSNDAMFNGFPKYSALPKIPDQPITDLIPYHSKNNTNSNSMGDVGDRINELEMRLNITEKSNRALLEEVVRLHGEFRSTAKHYEDAFKEERKVRSYIETNWKAGHDQIRELEVRLRQAEDGINQERYRIRDLANQSKNVEEQVFSTKKDSSILNERQISKISQLEREIESLYDDRHKLEKISFQLVDEMTTIKSKLESQGFDFSAITSELRNKSKRLEEEYYSKMDSMKKHLVKPDQNPLNDPTFRSMIDQRLNEMRDYINQIRNWHDDELTERRNLEQNFMTKFSELNHTISDQARNREEAIRNVQQLLREKEYKFESDKMALQNKLSELAESLNSKVLEKDMKLREEQLRRQTDLEKLLRTEQETRLSYEREIRQENERRMESLRNLHLEELNNIRDSIKHDKSKYVESVKRLDEAVSLIEQQIDENKHELTRILSAEVKSRTSGEKSFSHRIISLEEKIAAATASLQNALGGLADQSLPNTDRIKKMISEIFDEYRRETATQLGDLDARVYNLQNTSARDIGNIDEKIQEAVSKMNNSIKSKIESISLWQTTINTSLSDLKTQKLQLKQEIYEMKELLDLAESDRKTRFEVEAQNRLDAIANLREEMNELKNLIPKDVVTKSELEKVKTTSRKLAESMQTVKTVLGMKIQSEQKLRVEEIKNLQDDLIHLRNLIEPFIHSHKLPRIFVKSDEDADMTREDREINARQINQWSIYNANRWLQWKSKWMYVKWLVSNRNNEQPNDENSPETAKDANPSDTNQNSN